MNSRKVELCLGLTPVHNISGRVRLTHGELRTRLDDKLRHYQTIRHAPWALVTELSELLGVTEAPCSVTSRSGRFIYKIRRNTSTRDLVQTDLEGADNHRSFLKCVASTRGFPIAANVVNMTYLVYSLSPHTARCSLHIHHARSPPLSVFTCGRANLHNGRQSSWRFSGSWLG
ncbi:hypothetical protein RRG08_059047 [Elysia crispata]|uniref:Uncharacterized protein n=1 Tax=Elysia crispata TaxID=231223 RepID=A0AAE1DEF6_9GAST|nr:hypothetical protein RRG08_059047 [Elysia crispata]